MTSYSTDLLDSGTSGIWNYIKFESGLYMCFAMMNINLSQSIQSGNIYQGYYLNTITFPIKFVDFPYVGITNASSDTSTYSAAATYIERDQKSIKQIIFERSVSLPSNAKMSIGIQAIGRWK